MTEQEADRLVYQLALTVQNALQPCRLVVGLSGGADSTLLLLVSLKLTELNPKFTVEAVHCIHGLDEDDPVWLLHNQKLCQSLNVPLKTPKLHIVYGQGRSPEEVSRQERYAALLREVHGGALLLGHQADDQVENFLLALKRGSGPQGLSGMRFLIEDERGLIVRPLLSLSKARIEEILQALKVRYVYDISNSYLKFERNFIRLKVLPLLRERFAGIDEAILRSAKLCALEHDLAMRFARPYVARARSLRGLNLTQLPLEDDALMLCVLRLYLSEFVTLPPEYALLRECLLLCRSGPDQAGQIKLGQLQVRRYRNYLCVVKPRKAPEVSSVTLKLGESVRLGDYAYELMPTEDQAQGFNLEGGNQVTLKFSLTGSLRLHPKQRAHSRELKKLYGEYEVPYWERRAQCLVLNEQGIALALGSLCALRTDGMTETTPLYCLKITAL